MSTDFNIILEEGWGYCQIQRVEDRKRDGTLYVSKKGAPMVNLHLLVTDSLGKSARVFDLVTPEMNWKIFNLEEVFNVKGFYDFQKGVFNKDILIGKSGCCSLTTQRHDTYGEKTAVKMYVPLTFLEFMKGMHGVDAERQQMPEKKALVSSVTAKSDNFVPANLVDDDDGIPF